ncbi:MAG TPA: DNA primase [Solirubrobacteraceae bacterium]|nr:DNA primase [Solirubrobacteraceae bacterium]
MSRYPDDSKERVRDAVDMVALVSQRVELRRAGVNSYFGRCPFHDERTASFHVRPDEKHYHCFGCGESGDAFDFVMQTEGLDFRSALESLADRFGVTLEAQVEDAAAAARRRHRDRLHELLGRAATYYGRYLWESTEAADARGYLLGRGLTEETLRSFRVGYAPSRWDRMLIASRQAGYSDEELLAAGLVRRSRDRPGQVYDFFRSRIMFPTADARGRLLGFGARTMQESDREPKYINTAANELYNKRSVLYGIDRARAAAARAGRAILVEGYTDVLALQQAGIGNAVGVMGTSFTEEQATELQRLVGVLVLCLDSDSAGQAAMVKAGEIAARHGLELRMVPLPEGLDPAELLEREGADAMRERVEQSVPFVVFQVDRLLGGADLRSAEGRDRVAGELGPVLATVPPSSLREDLLRKVAGRLELSEARLAALMAAGPPAPRVAAERPLAADGESRPVGLPILDQDGRAERTFLVQCVAVPSAGREALSSIDPDQMLTSEPLRRAARHLASRPDSPLSDLPAGDEQLARIIADLVERAGRTPDVSATRVEHALLVLERSRIERAIRRARVEGLMDVGRLAREREQVMSRIHEVVVRLEAAV